MRFTMKVLTLSMMIPVTASAERGALSVGADGAFILPLGDFADGAGLGFGGLAKLSYALPYQVDITARVGYIKHLDKETDIGLVKWKAGWSFVPILVGAQWSLGSGAIRPYVSAEIGAVKQTATISVETGLGVGKVSSSTSKTNLGGTVGGGVHISGFDLGASLFLPSVGDIDDQLALMLNVGYDIPIGI